MRNQNLLIREITVPFFKKNIDGFCLKFFGELCLRKPNRKTIRVQGNVNTGWISLQKVQKIIPKNSWQMLAMHIYSVIHAVHNVQRSDFCRLLSAIGAQSWRSRYLGEKLGIPWLKVQTISKYWPSQETVIIFVQDSESRILFSIIYWWVVSTHLKNIGRIGNLPQIGIKTKNSWNHHLVWDQDMEKLKHHPTAS